MSSFSKALEAKGRAMKKVRNLENIRSKGSKTMDFIHKHAN